MTTPKIPAAASTGLLIILLCAMGAGPLFNYGISVSSALIIEELGITAGQIGFIVTVVFAAAAVSSIWLGNLADKISVRAQMLLIFVGTAVALVVAAFAANYWLLLVAAVLAGQQRRCLGLSAWSRASPGADACGPVPNRPDC